jgi:hypothetical protein
VTPGDVPSPPAAVTTQRQAMTVSDLDILEEHIRGRSVDVTP